MAPVVIDLDEAVGEDLEFILGGTSYFLPADIPTERMIRLSVIFERWTDEESDDDSNKHLIDLYETVLSLFRIRHPELASEFDEGRDPEAPTLALGARHMGTVVSTIFQAYNEAGDADEGENPLDQPAAKSASASSNGSRPSNASTGGGRKTGGRSAGKKSG